MGSGARVPWGMRCTACPQELPSEARFCPACGAAVPEEPPATAPLTVEGGIQGDWRWTLAALLLLERGVAWWAFSPDDPTRSVAAWEGAFLRAWTWAGALAVLALLARRRPGGWLAGLSGMALLVRSAIPLAAERPADGAVWALMVASATLTFAFFHEQSWWPRRMGE